MYQEDISKTPEITEIDQKRFVNVHSLLKNDLERKENNQSIEQSVDRDNNDSQENSQQIITNQRYGPRPGDSIDMDVTEMTRMYNKPSQDSQSQTDPSVYIRFACNLFLNEIILAIKDEKEQREM